MDQALFAGTSFILNILLARWLTPAQYGSFVLSFSVFLLLGIVHTSLITEPMLVLGSASYGSCFKQYFQILKRFHWRLASAIALILLVSALVVLLNDGAELAGAFLGLGFSAPAILFLWLSRRIFYIILSPRYSVQGGLAYGVGSIAIVYFFYRWSILVPFSAYLAIGFASLAVAAAFHAMLLSTPHEPDRISQIQVFSDHWRYGRWALPASLLAWIPGNAIYFLLSAWGKLEDGAAFRAVMNLQMPVLQINIALGFLLIPYFSKLAQSRELLLLTRKTGIVAILLSALAGLYGLLLLLINSQIFYVLYNGKFAAAAHLVPALSLFLIFAALSAVYGTALRAMQETKKVFSVTILTAGISLAAGFGLVPAMGVRGAVLTIIISSLSEAGGMIWFFYRAIQRNVG